MNATPRPDRRGYRHVQHGKLHWVLHGGAAALALGAVCARAEPAAFWIVAVAAAVMVVCGAGFRTLAIEDEGDRLAVRFGPLPLLATTIRYADIRRVERCRTRWIDGWGVHWAPGRGWTWNLWGFDAVRITLERGSIQLGTDDPDGLLGFLESRLDADRGATGRAGESPGRES